MECPHIIVIDRPDSKGETPSHNWGNTLREESVCECVRGKGGEPMLVFFLTLFLINVPRNTLFFLDLILLIMGFCLFVFLVLFVCLFVLR